MRQPDRDLLRGAIDTHAHTSPALFPRLLDDADLARAALDYGMRGFVLKDHDASTAGRAYHVKKMYPGVEPVSAIVLNRSVGGLDPHVAQAAIQYGARVVWMPTTSPSIAMTSALPSASTSTASGREPMPATTPPIAAASPA